jgi:FeS assembly SUF system protein
LAVNAASGKGRARPAPTLSAMTGVFIVHRLPCTLHHIKKTIKMENNLLALEEAIVKMLKTVYDPEIPVNVYDLGLIYGVETDEDKNVIITMTLTAPACPAADFIMEDVQMKIESVEGVKSVKIALVFEPEWHKDMMSEEAKLELGFL